MYLLAGAAETWRGSSWAGHWTWTANGSKREWVVVMSCQPGQARLWAWLSIYAWPGPGYITLHCSHLVIRMAPSEHWTLGGQTGDTGRGCIPGGDNSAMAGAVKDRQCLESRNKFGSERESGEFKWGPGRPGQCRALVKHSPMLQSLSSFWTWAVSSPGQALQHHPQPLLPFKQQQTTALLTQLVTTTRFSIMIHGCMNLGCLPGQEESGWGRGWSWARIVTLSRVRHFISAQTVISVISGSLPHFSLNPAPVFRPSHTPICLHIIDTVWPQTGLCKSVIELGLTSRLIIEREPRHVSHASQDIKIIF